MNYSEVTNKIAEKLPDYLVSLGIDPTKKFSCLHPDHDDKSPSASLIPIEGVNRVKCFSCDRTYGVFQIAHYTQGLPLNGSGFITETIPALIEELKLDIDLTKLDFGSFSTERNTAKNLMTEIGHIAVTSFKSSPDKKVKEEIKSRGWSSSTVEHFGLGQSFNINNYMNQLKSEGFYDKDIIDLGLADPDGSSIYFNDGKPRLFFPMYDRSFNVIGFALRALNDEQPKYLNNRNSIIYNKSKYLYGSFNFDNRNKKAYIMEGYTDVITMYDKGVKNALAYCSAAFTSEQISSLYNTSVRELIFCLDCDEASFMGVTKNIKENYDALVPYNVKIKMPNYGDPDEFIKKEGMETFLALPEIDFFTFYIKVNLHKGTDAQELCDECISLVLKHTNELAGESKLKQVIAAFDGVFSGEAIRKQYQKLAYDKVNKIESQINYLKKDLSKKLAEDTDPRKFISTIEVLSKRIESLYKTNVSDAALSPNAVLERILIQEEKEVNRTNEVEAFKFTKFKDFQEHYDGPWRDSGILAIGGTPNTGKTTYVCNLAVDLIKSNTDVCGIIHSIDDEAELIFTRLISILVEEEFGPIEMNAFRNPNKFYHKFKDLEAARAYGYDALKKLVKEGRLKIFDSRHGKTTDAVKNIMMAHKESSDRKGIFFLDNFHKLDGSERLEVERNISCLKDMSQEFTTPIFTTMEYKKFEKQREPLNTDLKESGKMEYDSKLLLHLHNDVHIRQGNSKFYYHDPKTDKIHPIIKCITGKTKVGNFKESTYYIMDSSCGLYRHINEAEVFTLKDVNEPYSNKLEQMMYISQEVVVKKAEEGKQNYNLESL